MDAVVPLRPIAAAAAAAAGEPARGLNGTEDALLNGDDAFMRRRNSSAQALGKLKRVVICGKMFYFAPDHCVFFAPFTVTAFLLGFNTAIAWPMLSVFDFLLLYSLVIGGFVCAGLVACTDPGVYPRLKPGEVDPLGDDKKLVFCRVCHIRRPPRTSHCYFCGVCVLEHDHHCGVIGGCVGLRSLRWFTLFVVCIGVGAIVACSWMIRFIVFSISEMPTNRTSTLSPQGATHTTTTTTTAIPTPIPTIADTLFPLKQNLHSISGWQIPPPARKQTALDLDEPNLAVIGACVVLFLDIIILLLVGGMGCMYTYLTLTSTTRRESKKGSGRGKQNSIWRNVQHTMFPPPSLLEGYAEDEMAALV